ncbi:MAG: PilZ domain-containing protein [Motiliproteus sp.]
MNDWDFDNDRRRHFRIQEQATIDYRLVTSPQGLAEEQFPSAADFNLLNELRTLDEEAETHLRRINEEDKSIAAYLRMLNRKVERIAQTLVQPEDSKGLTDITLSEGGISFLSTESLSMPATIAMRLQLLPEGSGLFCYAHIIYSQQLNDRYRIGCEFIDIDDRHRHLIARHLMESQARSRRSQQQRQSEQ